MLSPQDSREALSDLFARRRIVDIKLLFDALRTSSRMSVFRRISDLGYLTSYSHTGRYYTLVDVPDFDADGLWQCQGVLFSRQGSLKPTVEHLVRSSETGRTHEELHLRLRVRVHNALLYLVRQGRIARETLGTLYLYVSGDSGTAAKQMARRQEQLEPILAPPTAQMSPTLVIEVLLEVIHSSRTVPEPEVVRARLAARSVAVSVEQVEQLFDIYGLKKTAGSRSKRSRP